MSEPLVIFARLFAKSGMEEATKAECLKMIEPTRAEEGCLYYDCHQSEDNPAVVMFHESWTGRDALEQHMSTPHMRHMDQAMAEMLAEHYSVVITKMISSPARK